MGFLPLFGLSGCFGETTTTVISLRKSATLPPRRRESYRDFNKILFLKTLLGAKQDSRLRGNDGIY